MATINIGNLTFTHKGDYASGTAYVKNDVVYYSTNGNAYIAKQATTGNAPTNATYWNQFAAGSGGIWNAGLSLGSAGQAVKVNSAGNALEFGTAGGILQVVSSSSSTNYSQSGAGDTDCTNYNITITPSATSSKIFICMSFRHFVSDEGSIGNHEANGLAYIRDVTNSANIEKLSNINQYISAEGRAQQMYIIASRQMIHSPSTTSAITYSVRLSANSGYGSHSYGDYQAVLMEIAG